MGSHATLSEDGSIAVPEDVRRALGLKAGDRVEFRLGEDGRAELRRAEETGRAFSRMSGMLADLAANVSDEERERLVGEAIARKGRP